MTKNILILANSISGLHSFRKEVVKAICDAAYKVYISVPEEQSKVDLNISLYKKTKIDIDILHGKPLIKIDVFPEGTILSSGQSFDFTDNNNIKKVQDSVNLYLTNNIKEYLYKITKEYNSDIVGFKGIYKSKFLTEKDFEHVHWDEIFQDSVYEVSVNTLITSSQLFNKE